jgi:hypothetical protein
VEKVRAEPEGKAAFICGRERAMTSIPSRKHFTFHFLKAAA